ncbi:MAG: hypothetical protein M3R68_04660, partial [Acidobacteriota bacterium]|nr:hypothetical protein [Acidobacteriota bacterium]
MSRSVSTTPAATLHSQITIWCLLGIILGCALPISARQQNPGQATLKVIVRDERGQPVPRANCLLFRLSNLETVQVSATTND